MKKYIYLLSTCFFIAISCEGFLQKDPIADIGSEAYFTDETSLKTYTNGFIEHYTPSPAACSYGDGYCDIVVTSQSSNYLTEQWTPELQTGWSSGSWHPLYNINYFLVNFRKVKGVDEKTLAHYEGTGRFWRAWFYFNKVKTFGAVPYYTEPIDSQDTIKLYKPRDNREEVMAAVLEDLNYACSNLSTGSEWVNNGQINKYIALAFKSRVCLFEGTYRKYHSVDPSTGEAWKDGNGSNIFLKAAADAAKELMDMNVYKLENNPAKVQTQYRSLFINEKLNYNEVLWGVECNKAMTKFNDITWRFTSGSFGQRWSLDQDFVKTYLNLDGSRYTATGQTFQEEVAGRDYRLQQTIITPGYTKLVGGVPAQTAPQFSVTLTGYQVIKFNIDDASYESSNIGYNSLPIIRFAEVLLNYAEAKAELGEFGDQEWNQTIKLLRERSGVKGTRPGSADPALAAYYKIADKDLIEIRRERAIELFMEGFRYDDLMRWHLGELLNKQWYGMHVPAMDTLYDLNNDGVKDFCFSSTNKGSEPGVVYIIKKDGYTLEGGTTGRLIYNVKRIFDEQRYLRPVPSTALNINPGLGQNAAWK